jgi:hypothetical protein
MCCWITILFGKTKINDINLICSPAKPHQEVIRLDISVEETFRVNIFHPVDQLVCQHEHSFQGELPTAKVEQVFKTWPQQIKNQNIIVPLYPKPPDVWNPSWSITTIGQSRPSSLI